VNPDGCGRLPAAFPVDADYVPVFIDHRVVPAFRDPGNAEVPVKPGAIGPRRLTGHAGRAGRARWIPVTRAGGLR
jgi:hypothetical protein